MSVSFVPLMKVQAKSLRLPVDVIPSADDYHARRKRLGMVRDRKLLRRAELTSMRQELAADPIAITIPIPTPEETPVFVQDSWRGIVKQACHNAGISWQEFYSKQRFEAMVSARKEASYRMLMELGYSYLSIAKRIGVSDHSSALHLARSYAEINGLEKPVKILGREDMEARNLRIISNLESGMFLTDIGSQEKLDPKTVRAIAVGMGFDMSVSADGKLLAIENARRAQNAKERKAAQAIRSMLKQAKDTKRAEVRGMIHEIVGAYKSLAAASRGCGVSSKSLAKFAKEQGLRFGANK